jgi:hypothetical protein
MNKSHIMSLSGVEIEIQERLKKIAKKRELSVSALVKEMIIKCLGSNDDDVVDTVILKIPAGLKDDPKELEKWLSLRCLSIVRTLTK